MEIRRSYDRLISTMGFPILVGRHLYIESGPWWPQQGLLYWYPAMLSIFCNSFENRTAMDGLYGYQIFTLQWRQNGHDSVSNHQPHDCLLNRLFRRRSKKTSKLRVTGLCVGNSPWTGEFPAQMARNAENVSISWRHHEMSYSDLI